MHYLTQWFFLSVDPCNKGRPSKSGRIPSSCFFGKATYKLQCVVTRSEFCGFKKCIRANLTNTVLVQSSIEGRKWIGIALVLLYCALWLVLKTRAILSTNQMQSTTWSPAFSCAFSRAFGSWIFILSSHWLDRHFSLFWLAVANAFTPLNWEALF